MKTKLFYCCVMLGMTLFLFTSIGASAQWWQDWERHDDNPIISGPLSWAEHYFGPQVIHDEDGYKMWFTGKLIGLEYEREIGYAESDDGIEWEVHPTPVIPKGDPADWDYQKLASPVLKIDDTLHM